MDQLNKIRNNAYLMMFTQFNKHFCCFCRSDYVAAFKHQLSIFSYYLPYPRLYSGALLDTTHFGYPFRSFR